MTRRLPILLSLPLLSACIAAEAPLPSASLSKTAEQTSTTVSHPAPGTTVTRSRSASVGGTLATPVTKLRLGPAEVPALLVQQVTLPEGPSGPWDAMLRGQ